MCFRPHGVTSVHLTEMSCLMEALQDKRVRLQPECKKRLQDRIDMWSYAAKVCQPQLWPLKVVCCCCCSSISRSTMGVTSLGLTSIWAHTAVSSPCRWLRRRDFLTSPCRWWRHPLRTTSWLWLELELHCFSWWDYAVEGSPSVSHRSWRTGRGGWRTHP